MDNINENISETVSREVQLEEYTSKYEERTKDFEENNSIFVKKETINNEERYILSYGVNLLSKYSFRSAREAKEYMTEHPEIAIIAAMIAADLNKN